MSIILHLSRNFSTCSLRFISAAILLLLLCSCGIPRMYHTAQWETKIDEAKGAHVINLIEAWGYPNVLSKTPTEYHWMKRMEGRTSPISEMQTARCEMLVHTDEHGVVTEIRYSGVVSFLMSEYSVCYAIFPLP